MINLSTGGKILPNNFTKENIDVRMHIGHTVGQSVDHWDFLGKIQLA